MLLPAVTFVAGLSEFNRLHVAAYFLLLLALGFLPGSSEPNRFGEDPLERSRDATSARDR